MMVNIGEVARFSGLPPKTIRYYEDIGLVRPLRSENGYRMFDEDGANKLQFLARARRMGFSLQECRDLLALYDDRDRSSADVKAIAENHLADIDRRIQDLKALRTALSRLVETCHGDDRSDCPILEELAGESLAQPPTHE